MGPDDWPKPLFEVDKAAKINRNEDSKKKGASVQTAVNQRSGRTEGSNTEGCVPFISASCLLLVLPRTVGSG